MQIGLDEPGENRYGESRDETREHAPAEVLDGSPAKVADNILFSLRSRAVVIISTRGQNTSRTPRDHGGGCSEGEADMPMPTDVWTLLSYRLDMDGPFAALAALVVAAGIIVFIVVALERDQLS